MTMRRLAVVTAMLVTMAGGIASASFVSGGSAVESLADAVEPLDAVAQIGETVPDPRGGPPWAVRVSTTAASQRCMTVGRTDGRAFGPIDATGQILDTGPSFSGSCAVPRSGPLQVALARYADSGGSGPRSVLFGVADVGVASITIAQPSGIEPITPDRHHTFVMVRDEMARDQAWIVIATLNDGTQHRFPLG